MQQKQSVIVQAASRNFHICPVVFIADMFDHAHRNDPVELFIDVPVILQSDLYRQARAQRFCQLNLLFRNRNTDNFHPVFFGGVFGQTAPPAADIQHLHPGLQSQLPAD